MDDAFIGRIPAHLYMVLTKAKAQAGRYDLNPLMLESFNLNRIDVNINGESFPASIVEPKFSNKTYRSHITQLYMNLMKNKDVAPSITLDEFLNGTCIIDVSLEPELRSLNNAVFPITKQGNLRVNLGFAKALEEVVSLIVYARFPAEISVDHGRAVSQT